MCFKLEYLSLFGLSRTKKEIRGRIMLVTIEITICLLNLTKAVHF